MTKFTVEDWLADYLANNDCGDEISVPYMAATSVVWRTIERAFGVEKNQVALAGLHSALNVEISLEK